MDTLLSFPRIATSIGVVDLSSFPRIATSRGIIISAPLHLLFSRVLHVSGKENFLKITKSHEFIINLYAHSL